MRLSDLDWRLKIPLALTAVIVLTELVVAAALVTRTLRDARAVLEASSRNLVTVLGRSLREPMVRDHLWQAFEVVSTPIAARTPDNPLKLRHAHVLGIPAPPPLIQLRRPFHQLLFPATEQGLFDAVFTADLCRTLDAGQHFQHHLGFESPIKRPSLLHGSFPLVWSLAFPYEGVQLLGSSTRGK